jgi:hypothetical protein
MERRSFGVRRWEQPWHLFYTFIHLLSPARHLILIEVMNSACALVPLPAQSIPSNTQRGGGLFVSSMYNVCALSFDQSGEINNNTCSVCK